MGKSYSVNQFKEMLLTSVTDIDKYLYDGAVKNSTAGKMDLAQYRGKMGTGVIDTYRVLDSCRDKDCYEDVRVYLTEHGQKIIDHTCAIRIKSAHGLWTNMDINTMPFNRGFYQICIRIFCKICCFSC